MGATPLLLASTGIAAVSTIAAGQQARAAGRYQQTLAEQNAQIYEDKAERAIELGEYSTQRFEKSFSKTLSSVERAYASSGVEMRGTPLAIIEDYLTESEIEKANIDYNARMQNTEFKDAAVLSRMEGQLASYQGRQRQIASYYNAGSTLLGGFGQAKYIEQYGGLT